DRLSKRLAGLRVVGRQLQRAFGDADPARGDVDPSEFEAAGGLENAAPLAPADQMIGRYAIIVEGHFDGIDRLVSELLQFAPDRKAFHLRRDEKAHSLVARLRLGGGLYQHRKAR